MPKNSCFFVVVGLHTLRKCIFSLCARPYPSQKRYFRGIFALLPRNIHSRSNSSRVLPTLLSCCLPKL